MAELPTKFCVGRRDASKPTGYRFAFYIEHREGGGLKLSDVQSGALNDVEQHELFAHFGTPLTARTGGATKKGKLITFSEKHKPGTLQHFVNAAYSLPEPFSVISESYK